MERQLHISREFVRLQEEYQALREELVKLLTRRDELLTTVKPNLEAEYYTVIGKEQYRLYLVRNEVLRLRRKIELIRASLNRGEEPDHELIEARLDEELRQWCAELRDLNRRIEWAGYHNELPRLSAAETRELKKIYRDLVRKLHPDFNEALPGNFKYIWERVLTAYRNADLEELQSLSLLLAERGEHLPELSTMEQLATAIDGLNRKIKNVMKELAEMKGLFPFNFQEKLADAGWVAAQQKEMEDKIARLEQHHQSYRSILAGLGGDKNITFH